MGVLNSFKQLRNRINNRKKFEANYYKKEKMRNNLDDPAKMWKTSKEIMQWKSPGSPTQIEVENQLITSSKSIAEQMNLFFIEKVNKLRAAMEDKPHNLSICRKIMAKKTLKTWSKFCNSL